MKNVDVQKISALVEPVVGGEGYELVDLEWKHEAGSWVLRVYIDKVAGVSLEDCAHVSRLLSATLDVHEDTIPVHYNLEVSSPGVNRPLKRESDFARFVGQKAKIRTRHPLAQDPTATRRNFSGVLLAVENGRVKIDVGDATFDVPVDDVEKANLIFEMK